MQIFSFLKCLKNEVLIRFFQFQSAINCWIAACFYVVTLVLSGQQFYANSRNLLN